MDHSLLINSNADFLIFLGAAVFVCGAAGYLFYTSFSKSNSDKSSEVTPESMKNSDNRADTFQDSNLPSDAIVTDPTQMDNAAIQSDARDQIVKNSNMLTEVEDFSDLPELEPALQNTKIVFHSYRFPERNFYLLESTDQPSTNTADWCLHQPDSINTPMSYESSLVHHPMNGFGSSDKYQLNNNNNTTIPQDLNFSDSIYYQLLTNDTISAFSFDYFYFHFFDTVDILQVALYYAYGCFCFGDQPFFSYTDSYFHFFINLFERFIFFLELL